MYLTYKCDCVCVCDKAWVERSPSVYNPPAVYFVKAECFVAMFIFQGGSSQRPSNEKFPELERGSYSGWRVEVSDFLKRGYS